MSSKTPLTTLYSSPKTKSELVIKPDCYLPDNLLLIETPDTIFTIDTQVGVAKTFPKFKPDLDRINRPQSIDIIPPKDEVPPF